MANNFLKLNDNKSEFLILRPSRQSVHLSKVPAPLAIGRCQMSPAVSARSIRVIFDETMSMDKQIRQVCKSAFHQLHNIRSIRKFLDRDALQTLVHVLVTSKLDSFNSLYSGLPVCQIMKLQRVQNAAARLVLRIPRCEHITRGLKSLHWLPVEKDCLPCLQDPALFGSIVSVWFPSSICTGQTIEVGKSQPYGCARARCRHMGIASSLLLLQCSGISIQIASGGKRAWQLSRFHFKLTCLGSAMASSQKMLF